MCYTRAHTHTPLTTTVPCLSLAAVTSETDEVAVCAVWTPLQSGTEALERIRRLNAGPNFSLNQPPHHPFSNRFKSLVVTSNLRKELCEQGLSFTSDESNATIGRRCINLLHVLKLERLQQIEYMIWNGKVPSSKGILWFGSFHFELLEKVFRCIPPNLQCKSIVILYWKAS